MNVSMKHSEDNSEWNGIVLRADSHNQTANITHSNRSSKRQNKIRFSDTRKIPILKLLYFFVPTLKSEISILLHAKKAITILRCCKKRRYTNFTLQNITLFAAGQKTLWRKRVTKGSCRQQTCDLLPLPRPRMRSCCLLFTVSRA